MSPPARLDRLHALTRLLESTRTSGGLVRVGGVVSEVTAAACRVSGVSQFVKLGHCVELSCAGRDEICEVVRIDGSGATVKAFTEPIQIGLGATAWARGPLTLCPAMSWKGRILNALGNPLDGGPPLESAEDKVALDRLPPRPMHRRRLGVPLRTGIRAIDLFTPLCAGQRVGVFAGSGIGKSTLLAMLARAHDFDAVVIALVGERGREVREFIEDALATNRSRAVAVVATADESPMLRRLAPRTAMCIAEHFRDRGERVLLVVDSITRFAHACREVALAAGEPPVARGYPPGVFSELPRLLERAGPGEEGAGTITGVFAVLVDGDDHNDPVADAIRGTLDGHIVLSRAIADQGRYPAVDVLGSVSRLAHLVWTPEQRRLVLRLRAMIGRFEDTRDLRSMGGYRSGGDPELDKAVELVPRIFAALQQSPDDVPSSDAFQELARQLPS